MCAFDSRACKCFTEEFDTILEDIKGIEKRFLEGWAEIISVDSGVPKEDIIDSYGLQFDLLEETSFKRDNFWSMISGLNLNEDIQAEPAAYINDQKIKIIPQSEKEWSKVLSEYIVKNFPNGISIPKSNFKKDQISSSAKSEGISLIPSSKYAWIDPTLEKVIEQSNKNFQAAIKNKANIKYVDTFPYNGENMILNLKLDVTGKEFDYFVI